MSNNGPMTDIDFYKCVEAIVLAMWGRDVNEEAMAEISRFSSEKLEAIKALIPTFPIFRYRGKNFGNVPVIHPASSAEKFLLGKKIESTYIYQFYMDPNLTEKELHTLIENIATTYRQLCFPFIMSESIYTKFIKLSKYDEIKDYISIIYYNNSYFVSFHLLNLEY